MSAALNPYPEYRDSGVDWLGQVPTHWDVVRLKRLAEINPTLRPESIARATQAVFLPMKAIGVQGHVISNDVRPVTDVRTGFTTFERGDVLVAKITPCFENGKGAALVRLPELIGFGSTEFHVLRPRGEIDARWLYYWTRARPFRDAGTNSMIGAAGQQRVPSRFVADSPVPTPPPEEQRRIADFLDAYTAQVHRLVAAKRRLLKAVREQNQLALHELLVRGVDRNVPLAPSGHPWLGDVPRGWDIAPLKQFAAVNPALGRALPNRTDEVAFLPMERIGVNATVDYSERRQVQTVSSGFTSFAVGDVVLAKITPCFENGKSAWLNEMPTQVGFGTTELHVLRPTRKLRAELLLQWLRLDLFRQWGEVSMVGAAGQQRVPPRFVRDFVIAVSPSAEEQERMVAEAKALNEEHRFVTDRIRREIDLIFEYRDSLIAAVVTGRLDVRDAAIPVVEGDFADDTATDAEDMEDALDAVD